MDGLALLCNLFADGPVTLKRLRSAGVANLGELESAQPTRLAEWLHSSVPQAEAFAQEARKLVRRLVEEQASSQRSALIAASPRAPLRAAEPTRAVASAALIDSTTSSGAVLLQAGLFPGLDASLCARLALHHVRSVQALSEFAGLALARRTGIPYSTLLELSRQARRFAAERARAARSPAALPTLAPSPPDPNRVQARALEREPGELRQVQLTPFAAPAKRPPSERELARSDEFTLPLAEPESAGPFG